ncbi:MAG: sensor histidine kinase [Muribaculaceae bacterium]|nr:sensor histidine kinase [Muribaculaceae bacterium]
MKNIPLYIDLAFCIIVLPVMTMIFPVERWYHNFPYYVTSVGIWLYALYFLNRTITVPFLFKGKHKAIAGTVVITLSVIVTYLFTSVALYTPKPNIHDAGIDRLLPNIQQYQQAVWSLFMIVEAFSFAVGLLTQTNIQRSRRRAVEAERDKARINLYKAQIKPHFMFNTLNSLYGLFLTKDDNALPSLEKFISMMRYIHTSSMCDLVPLRDEVDYIRQYVGLQKLRLNEMTAVSLDIDINDDSLMIPPMLLVTFVENCFKHGVSPVDKSNMNISLHENDGIMTFMTSNRIFPVRHIGEHMGIGNCRRRLELLYPQRHRLDITETGNTFNVKLNISMI